MLNPHWSSRWSASPWWPLVLWFGLPVTLSNLSVACWQAWYMHLVVTAAFNGSGGPGDLWGDVLQFAMTGAFLLFIVQLVVASLVLVCGPGRFWLRLAAYWGVIAWLAGSFAASILLGDWLSRWLESLQSDSGWFVHDTHTTFTSGGAISAAAALPLVLLGFQAPFWILRVVVGWRLQRTATGELSVEENRSAESLSIRNLLEATALVAVSLGLLQLADRFATQTASLEQESVTATTQAVAATTQAEPGTLLFSMLAAAGYAAGGVFIVGLPLAMLFLRNVQLRAAWAITLGTVAICTGALAVVVYAAGAGNDFWPVMSVAFFGLLMLFSSQALALSLLRQYGWRLVGRSQHNSAISG